MRTTFTYNDIEGIKKMLPEHIKKQWCLKLKYMWKLSTNIYMCKQYYNFSNVKVELDVQIWKS